MGKLRRFLGKFFDPPAPALEDIVFERLEDVPQTPESQNRVRVSLEELIPCVPLVWMRSGNWSVQQIIEIPPEAFLEGSAERPAVVSLRFLAHAYPHAFCDPGVNQPDPGVDLPMIMLRETGGAPADLPTEMVVETAEQRENFAEWEGDERLPEQRAAEEKEAEAALRGVILPSTPGREQELPFESALAAQPEPAPPAVSQSSSRIRKILEAYADGLPSPSGEVPLKAPAIPRLTQPLPIEPLPIQSQLPRVRQRPPELSENFRMEDVEAELRGARGAVLEPSPTSGPLDSAPYRMRFEELGLSLSRFPEVKGFALWQAGHSSHTGDLGFDLELSALRLRLERLLEGAVQVQGAQDGFSSVTLNHARGGMSVFGSGSSLVAVAHQHDGLPSHLRAWMCGWVSQPLRG